MDKPERSRTQALGSRYELEEMLGVGAMGEVWRALDRQTGRHVAAKVLRAEFARDADIVTRFIQERSILLGLTHPNIVRVRDLVVEGERLAIVMDLVEGGDLRRHLREKGPVAPDLAVPLVCVLLDALASAHAAGCLHRDVKPDNVLLAAGDVSKPADARLSDFSIARLAHHSTVQSTGLLGTPSYMPPELFRDGQFSAASDVYATGILLYELLGGRTPFAGAGTAHTIGNRHVSSAPPRIPVSDQLWQVMEQMLAKEPRARQQAAATAAMLRGLPREALGAEALALQPLPVSWQTVQQTVVRRSALAARRPLPEPDLGEDHVETLADAAPPPSEPDRVGPSAPVHRSARPRARPAAAAALVLLVAGGLAFAATRGDPAGSEPLGGAPTGGGGQVASAQLTDASLPLGLTVARAARYDPATGNVELTITYSAGSAPLEGPFLEVLPSAVEGTDCPLAAWDGVEQQRSSTTSTGVRSSCPGYVVQVPALPPQGREGVSVVLSGVGLDLAEDPEALQTWLDDVSSATSQALAGGSVRDEQFPVQRVTGIWVEASPFSVRLRDEVRVEIGPRFLTGEEGAAFFDSFAAGGAPSGFLQQIAGGYDGVRLSTCSALTVNAQRQVIAQRPTDDCSVTVEVGKALAGEDSITVSGAGS